MRACNTILASHAAQARHRNVPLLIALCFIMAFALHFQIYKIFSYHVINLLTIPIAYQQSERQWLGKLLQE